MGAGTCNSMGHFCNVNINRDFQLPNGVTSARLTQECAIFNGECKQLFCTDGTTGAADHKCITNFMQDQTYIQVADGSQCWHKTNQYSQVEGVCYNGECSLPHLLANFAVCGNGGIDYNEQCDCGTDWDPSCDCEQCKLKPGKVCS